jgi:hypothetical protein
METVNDLDCRIFIDAGQTPDGIAALVAGALDDAGAGALSDRTVRTPWGEFEIRRNKEADTERAADFPDGFLYFAYTVEFYPFSKTPREERVSLAAKILNRFWDRSRPAVAVCDYEDQLPKEGGYKDRTVPWPAKLPQSNGFAPKPGKARQAACETQEMT